MRPIQAAGASRNGAAASDFDAAKLKTLLTSD